MKKISASLRSMITANPFLQFGFSHRLFNLTKLAKFLRPVIEARTQKSVQISAVTMNLSRLQSTLFKMTPERHDFVVEHIALQPDLCLMTFAKTPHAHQEAQKLYSHVQQKKGYMNITESNSEITLVFESSFLSLAKNVFEESPKYLNTEVTSVGVRFSEKYFVVPGLLYSIMQQINLQGINIIEISSTYTEFVFYIRKEDAKLAFETIFSCFTK